MTGEQRWISLVLAAGKGTRMKSDLAKVLHEIEGTSLLAHVLETASRLSPARTLVVVGHQADEVQRRHAGYRFTPILQVPQLGTGHAVMMAAPELENEPAGSSLLLLYGDVPLLRETTLRELMEQHQTDGNGATVLTSKVPDPAGYGRIIRDFENRLQRIVEDRDLEESQRPINEINSGIYAFQLKPLLKAVARLNASNAQGEYYLTDTLADIREQGLPVGAYCLKDHEEISGINTVEQLEQAAEVLRRRRRQEVDGCAVCEWLRSRSDLRLHRRDGAVVLLMPEPYNSGHLCVVPERHVVRFDSLSEAEASVLLELGAEAEGWLEDAYAPQAFNLGYNSGQAGVHLALHVIPRWAGDANFMPLVGGVNILPENLADTRRRIEQARARQTARALNPAPRGEEMTP